MNSLIGDSRVRNLKHGPLRSIIHDNWCTPGAKIADMESLVRDCVIMHHGEDNYDGKLHIYISAGICNLTKRIKGHNYKETIFDLNYHDRTLANVIEELNGIQRFTLRENAVPVFCTIYPLSFRVWNHTRLSQNKTTYLKFEEDYETMQVNLECHLIQINNHIFSLNKSLNMSTPDLANQIKHKRSKGKYSLKLNWLVDGCHPGSQLKNSIQASLAQAIAKNRK